MARATNRVERPYTAQSSWSREIYDAAIHRDRDHRPLEGRRISPSTLEWGGSQEYGLQFRSVRAFNTQPSGLSEYWERVQGHAEEYGSGSVLLGMEGRYDHWSCIRSMTERAISLVDSDGIKRLYRDRCTIAAPTIQRTYLLRPTQTLLITG